MAKQRVETNEANTKALDAINKALAKLAQDATIKAVHQPITIFKYHVGALICQNCGYTNPPDQDTKDPPACIECGLTHQLNIYVGPYDKPDFSQAATPDDQAFATPLELSEAQANGEQSETSGNN